MREIPDWSNLLNKQPLQNNIGDALLEMSKAMSKIPAKRKVFVSYHHKGDQRWYDEFSRLFCDTYEVFYDNSLQRKIDSDNTDYVDRQIREKNIIGTSITIVLCGAETSKRKYVDWEINSTLHHKHALLGICLPTNKNSIVPSRYYSNWQTGYAHWINWTADQVVLRYAIENAIIRSINKSLIDNSAIKMIRNRL